MKIETKMDVGDYGYFLFQSKVRKQKITAIEIRVTVDGHSIDYLINTNPCGNQYTRYFRENLIFKTKEELLESL